MYRVLIVDDESYVVDWITSLLESREKPELDVVGAYSAAEALDWLDRAMIDILVTDIQMPEMSGIELAEKVRQGWPHCKIIFLTAYREFSYAYEAIRNNVVGYLLKTESDERILAVVDQAVETLEKKTGSAELLKRIQEQRLTTESALRGEVFSCILNGSGAESGRLLRWLVSSEPNFSAERPFCFFLSRTEDAENRQAHDTVRETVRFFCAPYFTVISAEYSETRAAWILQEKPRVRGEANPAAEGRGILFLSGLLEISQNTCMVNAGIGVSFALHGKEELLSALPAVFLELNRTLGLTPGGPGFIFNDSVNAVSAAAEPKEDAAGAADDYGRDVLALKVCLENQNREQYFEKFERVTAPLRAESDPHSLAVQEASCTAAACLLNFIAERSCAEKLEEHGFSLSDLLPRLAQSTCGQMYAELRAVSIAVFDLLKEEQGDFSGRVVFFLRSYIDAHLTEDISLVKLSEVSGYNASYLSRFFKKATGETLNSYISHKRLELVNSLMLDPTLNFNEISRRAGFSSRTYFNRFIRRMTGLSPQDLRENALNKRSGESG